MNPNTSLPEPAFSGISLRPASLQDAPGIFGFLQAIAAADGSISTVSMQDIENLFTDGWSDPRTDSMLASGADGKIVGLAWVLLDPVYAQQKQNPTLGLTHVHAEVWCNVSPENPTLNPTLEVFLLRWASGRAASRINEAGSPDLPRYLLTNCWEDQIGRIILLEGHGYQPIRYFARMHRDLRQSIPTQPLADGLKLCTFSQKWNEPLRLAYNEIFKHDWNFQYASPPDWQRSFVGRLDFYPELTFLALEGESIVGFSLNHVHQATTGAREGYITYIGTLPAWRKRGVASALLSASLNAFREKGILAAALGVDTDNPDEPYFLYTKLGFAMNRRLVQYARQLQAPAIPTQ